MSWNAIIVGDVQFPDGGVDAWKGARARVIDYDWPAMVAQAVSDSSYDEEEPSVETVLDDAAAQEAYSGSLAVDGDAFRIRLTVDGSNYSILAEQVVRVLCAAAYVGASGRVLFCYANDAVGSGHFHGALLVLGDGALSCEHKDEPMRATDKQLVDEVVDAVLGKSKRA